jgi:heme-degrading monooxygenase HmoA
MFTRTVEVTPKSGKARELVNTINEKVLPILKKQPGFVDETLLVSDAEPNQILALSFWNTKEDAERYQREQYPAIQGWYGTCLRQNPSCAPSMSIAQPHTESLRKKPLEDLVDSRFSGETQHRWALGPARACSYPKKEGPGMSAKM